MASAQMRKFSELIRARRAEPRPPIPERRRQMEEMQARLRVPEDVAAEDVTAGGRPARWVRVPGSRPDRVMLYLHGGGYIQGSLDTHHELMGRVARACECRVLGLDYRLAPEAPFPGALDDALAAYRWLLESGQPGAGVMLGGDSAGGGLALAALIALRDRGLDRPAGAVLISPWTDLTCSGESYVTRADADPMIAGDYLRDTAKLYFGEHDPLDPRISPLFGDLSDLPPLLVQVGGNEVLLDDSRRVVERVQAAGGRAQLDVWEEAFHVFQSLPQLPESDEALTAIGAFYRAHTA